MLRLYNKLSEYGVVLSIEAKNECHLIQVEISKGIMSRYFIHTYESTRDTELLVQILLQDLNEFMAIWEEEFCFKNGPVKFMYKL